MDIVGSREISELLGVSQETARAYLRSGYFDASIQMPGSGKRKIIKTTKRALLKKAHELGYPLSLDDYRYLHKLSAIKTAPNGSGIGQPADKVEPCQPVV